MSTDMLVVSLVVGLEIIGGTWPNRFRKPDGAVVQNILTRWALAITMGSIAVLLGLSTFLNVGHRLLVGSADWVLSAAVAAEKPVDGSIPGPAQPISSSGSPRAALIIDVDLSDPSVNTLLSALEKTDDEATFFVVGNDIPGNETTLRRIVDAGHEIGLGSFNRSRISDLSSANQVAQYRLTRRYVEGATGRSTELVRLPYSVDAKSLSQAEVVAAENLHAAGFTTVFADKTLESVTRPADIDGENQVILVGEQHEAQAVEELLAVLQEERYELDTVSVYSGVGTSVEIGIFRQIQSRTLLWSTAFQYYLWSSLSIGSLGLGVFLIARHLVALLIVAGRRRLTRTNRELTEVWTPSVSVLVPARNAEQKLKAALESIKRSEYAGSIEIMVIDDGSTDGTASVGRQVSDVRVLSQTRSGRATAINEGIRKASYDICVLTYDDAEFDPYTLARLVEPLSNPTVALVTGYAVNKGKSWLRNMGTIERVSSFHINQRMEIMLGLGTETCGAATAVRRSAVVDIGGVSNVTSAENIDLTVALGVRGWDLGFEPTAPVTVTGVTTIQSLWQYLLEQRYGMLQVMWKHRRKHLGGKNSSYRVPALLYRLVTDFVTPIVTPLIDVFVLAGALLEKHYLLAAIWFGAVVFQLGASWMAVMVSNVKGTSAIHSIPHFFFFRYLNFFVAARALSLVIDGRHTGHEGKSLARAGSMTASSGIGLHPIPAGMENR